MMCGKGVREGKVQGKRFGSARVLEGRFLYEYNTNPGRGSGNQKKKKKILILGGLNANLIAWTCGPMQTASK